MTAGAHLDANPLPDPDTFELSFHNFPVLVSLADLSVSLVSLGGPLQLICFLTCITQGVAVLCQAQAQIWQQLRYSFQAYAQGYDCDCFSWLRACSS